MKTEILFELNKLGQKRQLRQAEASGVSGMLGGKPM
ncbi:hypothetical protein GTHT12_01622 [Geobacillus thermodenitrificans]|jgi:hypothetical protein|nr:hypothetical protein GTHT12_01622 [Geobacillus thermodenitrificans]KQB92948.1 hypothetical protein GEPA3_2070 [Geobacillus sp. PA-3]MEC5189358.1 hypothetical protein [Geobacillus thermodenitrificans]